MSQEYFPYKGKPPSGESSSKRRQDDEPSESEFSVPQAPVPYMTVGNGTMSTEAEALMASLNRDSGYGGSISGESAGEDRWRARLLEDRPTPAHTPTRPGEFNPAGMCGDPRDGWQS